MEQVFAPVMQKPFLPGITRAYVVMYIKEGTARSLTVVMQAETHVRMVLRVQT